MGIFNKRLRPNKNKNRFPEFVFLIHDVFPICLRKNSLNLSKIPFMKEPQK